MNKLQKIRDYQKLHGTIQTFSWLCNNVKFRLEKLKSKPIEFDYITLTEEDDKNYGPKTKNNIFIFGSVPYYDIGGGQRSAQLAKTFNKLGYQVFYIFAFDSSESKKFNLEIPCVMHKYINNVDINELSKYVKENDIAIFEAPYVGFKEYIEMFANAKASIVYENIDNWESHLGNNVFDADTLKLLLESASLLTGTALPLVDQLNNYIERYNIEKKQVLYLANAVDDELFNHNQNYEKPKDLITGDKTLIYYGSLWGDWFDWDLVYGLANNNPDITINLIGDASSLNKTNKPDNVYFLGIKKQVELPAYLSYSDYAILPFKVDMVGKYVSPLKIFEYIAMQKKIIATSLPDIVGYPNLYTGTTLKRWQTILDNDKLVDTKKCMKFTNDNNWYNRCFQIIEGLSKKGVKKCLNKYYENISVVVLNYNNKNVIFRCIDSLKQFQERYNYEIIVVDNKSSDGSYEELLNNYKRDKNIKIVQNIKNGCASGRNLGVKNATKDFIVFLDSDQWVLHKYWLDNYIEMYNNIKDIGAVAWNAGWFNEYGLSYRFVDNYALRAMYPSKLARKDIGYLATCGFLISKKVFDKIGGFDENYDPTCYEDSDLALKVRDNNKEIYYSPYLGVGHIPHQTTKAGSSEHDKLILEKGNYFVDKWKKKNPDLLNYKK